MLGNRRPSKSRTIWRASRQYGLADRARSLGWQAVEVIDDDLGRFAGGIRRPGFEKLLAVICEGRDSAVMSLEASRLARNGRDWHTSLEFCGLVSTIIVNEDGVYDPALPNDRLLLGMKGTMSEMELSVFRQRSVEAMKQKLLRQVGITFGSRKIERETLARAEAEAKERAIKASFAERKAQFAEEHKMVAIAQLRSAFLLEGIRQKKWRDASYRAPVGA